jgi:hypothetical protein
MKDVEDGCVESLQPPNQPGCLQFELELELELELDLELEVIDVGTDDVVTTVGAGAGVTE